jgi:hypothetical protein
VPVVRVAAKAVYLLLGTASLSLGLVALLVPSAALPPDSISALTVHLVREQAAHGIFLGLMAWWCFWRFEQRRSVHVALLIFAALFAVIHWAEFLGGRRELLSPILNTLPFLALCVTTPVRGR